MTPTLPPLPTDRPGDAGQRFEARQLAGRNRAFCSALNGLSEGDRAAVLAAAAALERFADRGW